MDKKSNSFVYLLWVVSFFPNNFARVCPVKLKIDMFCHMKNTFRNTLFYISVDVPLTYFSPLSSVAIVHLK